MKFQKGNTYGKGREAATLEERELKKLTRTHFRAIVHKYLLMPVDDMVDLVGTTQLPTIDCMLISVLHSAIKTADEKKLNWFIEHIFGKPPAGHGPAPIHPEDEPEAPKKIDYSKLTKEQLQSLIAIEEALREGNK